ncbi:phosphoribosylamine--glycine ligase [Lacibacter sp. H407]|uniref:phosphoribosylamine--glycine ligase n=1 Tax=Lacibacter sp. H407 TaxID=3133423 RepID=UPI0030C46B3E
MNILLLGSGGREHALSWKLTQSPLCDQLYIAPGNAGTSQCGINVQLRVDDDFAAMEEFCRSKNIHLVIVGPEDPLVKGVYDYFETAHQTNPFTDGWLGVIGPSKYAAQLEGSKAFAKAFMERHNIPTASYREFTDVNFDEGREYLMNHALPVVLKADGLAAGKGVIICNNHLEAVAEFDMMIHQHKFGDAGKRVVIEEFLNGIEMSVFVLTDGKNYCLLPEAKDYKRIGEGDTGLNTGGMGAVSPVPFADDVFMKKVIDRVVEPTINGFRRENLVYKGFVFIGLIKVNNEPYVIEYNCRMGDPETEVVIPRLKNDLVELLTATANGTIDTVKIEQDPRFAVTMMAVSGGYPGDYIKGYEIEGLDQTVEGSMIFHAGTAAEGDTIVTSGGRVLAVTSMGNEVADCVAQSKNILSSIRFKKMYYRSDIGYEFLNTN